MLTRRTLAREADNSQGLALNKQFTNSINSFTKLICNLKHDVRPGNSRSLDAAKRRMVCVERKITFVHLDCQTCGGLFRFVFLKNDDSRRVPVYTCGYVELARSINGTTSRGFRIMLVPSAVGLRYIRHNYIILRPILFCHMQLHILVSSGECN